MREKKISKGDVHNKGGRGILIGIPLSLFVCGIILITIGTYNYMKSAFFLSGMLLSHDNYSMSDSVSDNTNSIYPEYGEEFGDLIIASAGIDYPVFNGDSDEQLQKGIGHYFGSRYPGENGKVVLDGHRNTVFKNLGEAKTGDTVLMETSYGTYTYKVSGIRITDGNDQSITEPADGIEKLVLYTCYPFNYIGNAPKRYVVTCDLVEGVSK
jgi:sortase A